MKYISIILLLLLTTCQIQEPQNVVKKEITLEYAQNLAQNLLIIDTHVDLLERLHARWENISVRTEKGHTDYPRMQEGGLNAPFMSIYIPASRASTGTGKELADTLINMVEGFETKWPDKFKIARSPDEVIENFKNGLVSLPMGIENGTAIEGDLSNLEYFYDRGVRYMTLTHSRNNLIGASSFDFDRTWDGLTEFGEKVVKEMNRLGIMVDISHVSDSTFWDIMKITQTPPIASHSSCRFYTEGMERNMSDEMIKALADKGGVMMINFGAYFISGEYREKMDVAWDYVENNNIIGEERTKYFENYMVENNVSLPNVTDVAQHMKHVIDLVGVDYVGMGSDFDGVRDLPIGLSDVSMYPNLIYELLKLGYSEQDIEKICSGNILRVWKQTEDFAAKSIATKIE